jgi:hypothetical protein
MHAIPEEMLECNRNGTSNGCRARSTEPSPIQQFERFGKGNPLASMVRMCPNGYVWNASTFGDLHLTDSFHRISSMTMGRPPMTPDSSHIPLPSPVDDKHLAAGNQEAQQPKGTISTNQFLHQNMRLIGILWKILLKIYRSEDEGPAEESSSAPEGFKALMDLDRLLEEFKASLPPIFAWGSPSSQNTEHTFRRQSNVLHAR